MFQVLEGGCLCGAIQYRISGKPLDAAYCHCRLCQQSGAAPVVAWLTALVQVFSYTKGEPAIFHSSAHSQREFCGACGTQLAFRRTKSARTVDVTLASLRNPSRIAPQYHIWRQSRIAWFETADALPRHDDAGPDTLE